MTEAYEILCDPEKRREHDRWIEMKEQAATSRSSSAAPPPPPASTKARPPQPRAPQTQPAAKPRKPDVLQNKIWRIPIRVWLGVVVAIGVAILMITRGGENKQAVAVAAIAAPAPQSNLPQAPVAPTWPDAASYLPGSPTGAGTGFSYVTVINDLPRDDLHVKLTMNTQDGAEGVRDFFIPHGQRFVLEGVPPGNYFLSYVSTSATTPYRSGNFALSVHLTTTQIKFSTATITLVHQRHDDAIIKLAEQSTPISETYAPIGSLPK